jgi:membrane associated rhomboid family serine protease
METQYGRPGDPYDLRSIEASAKLRLAKPPLISLSDILTAIVVATTLCQLTGLEASVEKVGLVKTEVHHGEVWRLLTCGLIHGSVLHILLNAMSLRNCARGVELMVGKWAMVFCFFVAVIGGSLFSLYFKPFTVSVGASGGILGLVGLLCVLVLRHRRILPPGFGGNMVFNLALVVAMGILIPQIDNFAHLGGFVAGVAVGVAVIPGDAQRLQYPEAGWIVWSGRISLGIIVLASAFSMFKMLTPY